MWSKSLSFLFLLNLQKLWVDYDAVPCVGRENAGWRTMLVVPELEMELNLLSHTSTIRKVQECLERVKKQNFVKCS
jgi:hypothetical protein